MYSTSNSSHVDLSIVIPVYNEARRIGHALSAVHAYVTKHAPASSEIIVVDDGSIDETHAVILAALKAEVSHLRLIRLSENQGKGHAVRTGIRAAHGKFRLFIDVGNSTEIHHWTQCRPLLHKGADIIISSRKIKKTHIIHSHKPLYALAHRIFDMLARPIAGISVSDTQSGFKVFTAESAEALFEKQIATGWAFDVEILRRAKLLGLQVAEIPIESKRDIVGNHASISGITRMFVDLVRIRLYI